jgi:L-cysteine:1D-myo-inositol 2-amino-2-deoxy-alpha-D-glucopyranoside ligase
LGHEVKYVQNVTDIDDDILKKSKQVGQNWRTVGNRWTTHFIRDMKDLNVKPPDQFPRATEVIDDILMTVEQLVDAGVAYEAEGNVYFDIDAWDEFGKLSRLNREEMLPIANQRGNHPDDPHKKKPLDFVLWQAQSPGEPAWESPWGPGRPGWHIECSTMATKYLGDTIDVHIGGSDLLFPHHECEIAQVEPITGKKPFVRYWMHIAMVRHEGEKMSKSLGNLVMVRDLFESWSHNDVRLYMAMHHYRHPWNHNLDELDRAAEINANWQRSIQIESGYQDPFEAAAIETEFMDAMQNDLNTPAAVNALEAYAYQIIQAAQRGQNVIASQKEIQQLGGLFGLVVDGDERNPKIAEGWEKHLERFLPIDQLPTA